MQIMEKLPEIKATNQNLIIRAAEVANDIHDDESNKSAGNFVLEINRRIKWWDDLIDPVVKSAFTAHKEAAHLRNEIKDPLDAAKRIIGEAMARFDTERRRQADEEADMIKRKARQAQEKLIIDTAASLERDGEKDAAEAVLNTPIVDVRINLDPPKVDGISFTERYHAEVTDLMALVKAVAAGEAPLVCIKPDMVFLNRQASSLKSEMRYAGVRAVSEKTTNVKS